MPAPSTSEEQNEQVTGSSHIATNRTNSREMDHTSIDNIEQNNSRGHENHQNASREINVSIPTDPNDIMFENEDLKLYVERGNQIFDSHYPDSRYLDSCYPDSTPIIRTRRPLSECG